MIPEEIRNRIILANDRYEILGYRYKNKDLLFRALMRAQYAKERRDKKEECEDQTSLATLGDSLLRTALTDILFHKGVKSCDDITKQRIELERNTKLAEIAKLKKIGHLIIQGKGETGQDINNQPGALATTLEALLGAAYLDSDCSYDSVKMIVAQLYL